GESQDREGTGAEDPTQRPSASQPGNRWSSVKPCRSCRTNSSSDTWPSMWIVSDTAEPAHAGDWTLACRSFSRSSRLLMRCFARGRFDSSQRQMSVRASRMIQGGLRLLVALILGVLFVPLSSGAQPPAQVSRIGMLVSGSPATYQFLVDA